MKDEELTLVTGSLYYKAIILDDGDGNYFLRVMDDNGFWSQKEIDLELAEEVINHEPRMDRTNRQVN